MLKNGNSRSISGGSWDLKQEWRVEKNHPVQFFRAIRWKDTLHFQAKGKFVAEHYIHERNFDVHSSEIKIMPVESGYASSPVSTPNSSVADNRFLVKTAKSENNGTHIRLKWYDVRNIPLAILTVSFLQVVFHVFTTRNSAKALRFEPGKRTEIWRLVTYMLVHEDWLHLGLNVLIQCIFAAFLELRHGRLKVLILYILGGVTGVLGAACIHPDLVIGASAGGYCLLFSNVADIILNYETIKYKLYKATSIAILVLFDAIYDIVHVCWKKEPQVSWQAHGVGGLTGLLLGLVFFKNYTAEEAKGKSNLFWIGLGLYFLIVMFFIVVTLQISKCNPTNVFKLQYTYLC